MSDRDKQALIAQAVQLAKKAHAGQYDKLGRPYIEHVLAVARSVEAKGPKYEIVAILHDSLEDCDDVSIVSLEILIQRFGCQVSAAVDAMTKRDGEDYRAYLERLRANPIALAVKIADIAHNVSRIPCLLDENDRTRLLRKYGNALGLLGQSSDHLD